MTTSSTTLHVISATGRGWTDCTILVVVACDQVMNQVGYKFHIQEGYQDTDMISLPPANTTS